MMSDGSEQGLVDRGRAPDAEVLHERARRRTRLVRTGVVLAMVLLVTLGVVGVVVPQYRGAVEQWRHDVRVPAVPGHARSGEEAALGYLMALSRGRSADALAYLSRAPRSAALMTDDMLAESQRINPITDIKVGAATRDNNSESVSVEYYFGPLRVDDQYNFLRGDDGFWRIGSDINSEGGAGYFDIPLGGTALKAGVAAGSFTLNGVVVPPTTASLELFPGTYQVKSLNPMIEASPDTIFLPQLSGTSAYDTETLPTPLLTPDAEKAVHKSVTSALDDCLREDDLVTSCGLMFAGDSYLRDTYGSIPVDSTARWSLDDDWPGADATEPVDVAWGGRQTNYCDAGDVTTGVWAEWATSYPSGYSVTGTAGLRDGQTAISVEYLYRYVVNISDPKHLKVYFVWHDPFSEDSRCG